MNWADLALDTLAPWSIVGLFVVAILRGALVTRSALDKMVTLLNDTAEKQVDVLNAAALSQVELLQGRESLMKERLSDKDKVITEGIGREDIQRRTIAEQAEQIRALARLAETTNRVLDSLPRPRVEANEPA